MGKEKMKNNNREAQIMMTEAQLLATAELEAGRNLTETEKWFVWIHPSLTFSEIRQMLDKESKSRKELALRNQKPCWPAFG